MNRDQLETLCLVLAAVAAGGLLSRLLRALGW